MGLGKALRGLQPAQALTGSAGSASAENAFDEVPQEASSKLQASGKYVGCGVYSLFFLHLFSMA